MNDLNTTQNYGSAGTWTADFLSEVGAADREYVVNGSSYRSLHRLAAGIRSLGATGVGNQPLLCLCTENKALLAAAILASLGGGPRLVLPYAFSRQAVEEVLKTMNVSLILADHPGDFPPGPQVICPSMLEEVDADSHRHDYIDADEPFLLLFTGGSTGTPKVWAKTPRNMIAEARYMITRFGITPEDIFLSTVPPQHIYGLLFSVLIPLIASARILEGIYVFPREIMKVAREEKATVLVSVPACYRVFKGSFLNQHHLRLAFSSAGALDPGDSDYFRENAGLDINEIYGSTETGGVATRRRGADGDAWHGLGPVQWRITDGRLQVKSPFISPSLPRNTEGFFVTADRAVGDGPGCFVLKGRADDVVKVGGKRVDLAEIREKMMKIDGLRDALLVQMPNGKGRPTDLVALVVTEIDPAVLRQALANLVEPYAMPRRFVTVDKIPVTPTGKYDRGEIQRILDHGK